jgi:hypothetical protein
MNHSIDYVKRKAWRLKKAESIPHHVALNRVCVELGFKSWRHFLSQKESALVQLMGKKPK